MAIGTGHTTKCLAAWMCKEWQKQPSHCVVGPNIWAATFFYFIFLCICVGGTLEKCNPAWVLQSAEASQPTGWPCVASRMSTKMTHQLLSIFNSLDASPFQCSHLFRRGCQGGEWWEKQAEVICNYTEWIQPPTSVHCTNTVRDNEMEGKLFFPPHTINLSTISLASLIYGVE